MNYQEVVSSRLQEFNDEEQVDASVVAEAAEVPQWWGEAIGPEGGSLIADAWDQLAPGASFSRTKELLRSPRALGAAVLRAYPGGHERPARWNLVVALDYLPAAQDEGPTLLRFGAPMNSAMIPPWWEYVPPALRDFYLNAHGELDDRALVPIIPGVLILASERFDPDDPEDLCAFQLMPDPRELVIVGTFSDNSVYLDIGQKTYQGWEIPGGHDLFGGPRPVDLIDTIDAYVVGDPAFHADLPDTSPEDAPRPAPLRPRNPEVDWPSSSYFSHG